jgi:hypothetical protein
MNLREAAKAGDTNFTNAFVLRPRFATTLAVRLTNSQKRTEMRRIKKAAQSKLSGFAGW